VKVEEQEKKWDWDSQASCPLFYFMLLITDEDGGLA
jgi:hypothetical protein